MALTTQTSLILDLPRAQHEQLYDQMRFNPEVDSLPTGFPTGLSTHMTWNSATLNNELSYTYFLTSHQVLEIETALVVFKGLELHGDYVAQENFPLPNLRHVLEVICEEVHNGKGFFVLRGLDLNNYSVEDSTVIFLGIQSYIAEQRARQDDSGNMIVHIISKSSTAASPTTHLHSRHSKKSIAFHNEETGDIITWQTRNTAARGGRCILSSVHTIYNILATTRPDIIRLLAAPNWPVALPYFHRRPLLYYHDSHLILNFGRAALLGSAAHPRCTELPSVTARQREALDVLEDVARSVEVKLRMQRGDIHFVNNLAVLHRREEFVDGEGNGEASGKRHLVRMRIRNASMAWELPKELKEEWEKAFKDEGERVWHLEPMPEGFFPLRKYSN